MQASEFFFLMGKQFFQFKILQWNLSIMVAHGPEINGCNREVAALKKCLVYGILPIGA